MYLFIQNNDRAGERCQGDNPMEWRGPSLHHGIETAEPTGTISSPHLLHPPCSSSEGCLHLAELKHQAEHSQGLIIFLWDVQQQCNFCSHCQWSFIILRLTKSCLEKLQPSDGPISCITRANTQKTKTSKLVQTRTSSQERPGHAIHRSRLSLG